MNRKNMPLLLMLGAAAVTSILTYVMHYTILQKLIALLVVLLIFYVLGSTLRWVLDTFEAQNEKAALDEGEVIEKDDGETVEMPEGEEAQKKAETAESESE